MSDAAPSGYTARLVWFAVPLSLLLALAGAGVIVALGSRLRRLCRLPCPPRLAAPVEWMIGSWALATAVLLAGLAGGMSRWPLLAVVLAAAAAGRWRAARSALRQARPFLIVTLPLLPVALAPPFFYDSWVYHLGLPWQALREGGIAAHPENLFSAFPPLAQLVYAPALAFGQVRVPGTLHLIAFCMAGQAVAGLAIRLGARRLAALIAGLFIPYAPVAVLVPAFPAAEGWLVTGVVCTLALALTARSARAAASLAGWTAGAALAARLQGLPWTALAFGLAGLASPRRLRATPFAVLGVVLGALPWWLKNGVLLGRPLAPLGWVREGIETLWRDGGATMYLASGPADAVERVVATLGGQTWILLPVLCAALIGALGARRRAALLAVAAGAAGVLVWAMTGTLGRFLVPALAVLVAVAVTPRRPGPRAVLVSGLLVASFAVPGVLWTAERVRWLGGFRLLGEPGAVYARLVNADPAPGFAACAALPENARVLMVAEPRGFLMPRPFVTTSQHDPSPLRDVVAARGEPDPIIADLLRRGFTHLLVNVEELERLGRDYPVLPWRDAAGRESVGALVRRLSPPVIRSGPIVVYALERPGLLAARSSPGGAADSMLDDRLRPARPAARP